MKKIVVSDITLKAIYEQDLSLTFREKLAIAEKLDASLVDAIELPVIKNSKENEVIYRTIAGAVKNACVKIPVGFSAESLEVAVKCVSNAYKPCLQVVLPISTAQMEYFYHVKAPVMLEKISALVKAAKEVCECVEFVALDAFRAEEGFAVKCIKTAYEAGAAAVTIADDAGEAFPEDYDILVKEIKNACPVDVFVQPSNAFSMASACAFSAIKAGADGVKTSAIGSYLSMSTVSDVMRAKKYELNVDCNLDVTNVNSIVCAINGVADNVSEDSAQSFDNGNVKSTADMNEVSSIIKQMGYELSDSDIGKVFEEFKKLTAKKDSIDMKELEAVIASTA
ncbi:MAG: hypothetical protein J6C62_08485, partial [Clostridia bacterium]|nr:hypothetical protein [Clostridia bacterium]